MKTMSIIIIIINICVLLFFNIYFVSSFINYNNNNIKYDKISYKSRKTFSKTIIMNSLKDSDILIRLIT